MTFFINAWLERENPILELRESSTNRMVYHLEGEPLNDWLNSGELSASDFNSDKDTNSVIRELLLKSITEDSIKEHLIKHKVNIKSNNVIQFPGTFRKPCKENYKTRQPPDNIVYLFSVLSQRFLKQLNDAIY